MSAIDDTLINIAVFGSAIGIGILIAKNRFQEQWEILFPTKQQLYESRTKQLEFEKKKLQLLKDTLTKYKNIKTEVKNLTKETNDLTTEIAKLDSKGEFHLIPRLNKDDNK